MMCGLLLISAVSDVFIVAAKRTAFGTFGGKFVKTSPTDLMVHASKAVLEAGKVNPELVNSVVIGNVIQVGTFTTFGNASLKNCFVLY